MKAKIKISNIFAYIQGHLRYKIYYSPYLAWMMRTHIREQIDWRINEKMDRDCYVAGSCKLCGCDTTALQMADKACDKPCYPPMMSKKRWTIYKFFHNDYRKSLPQPLETLLKENPEYADNVKLSEKDGSFNWEIRVLKPEDAREMAAFDGTIFKSIIPEGVNNWSWDSAIGTRPEYIMEIGVVDEEIVSSETIQIQTHKGTAWLNVKEYQFHQEWYKLLEKYGPPRSEKEAKQYEEEVKKRIK